MLHAPVCVRQLDVPTPRHETPSNPPGKPGTTDVCQVGRGSRCRDCLRAENIARAALRGHRAVLDNVHRPLGDHHRLMLDLTAHAGHGGTLGLCDHRWLGRHAISRRPSSTVVVNPSVVGIVSSMAASDCRCVPHTVILVPCTGGNGISEGHIGLRPSREWCRDDGQPWLAAESGGYPRNVDAEMGCLISRPPARMQSGTRHGVKSAQ